MAEHHHPTRLSRRKFLQLSAAGATALLLPWEAHAGPAGWPERTIFTVVGYAAGGGTDVIVRGVAKPAERILGRTINVTNRPGSVAALATDFIWKRANDGYWWLGTSSYNRFLRVQGLHQTVPWRDWQFFQVATSIAAWAVKPDSPYKTFNDLIEAAKKDPERIRMSNSGIGGVWHEATMLVEKFTGARFRDIPYEGGAPAVLSALRGEADVVASGVHEQIEQLRTGNLRNLAAFVPEPLVLPGAGTLAPVTQFVPKVKAFAPFGAQYTLGVRRDIDPEILRTIDRALVEASKDPEFGRLLERQILSRTVRTGREADREAAAAESVTAWLFWERKLETAKVNPAELGIPKPEDFESWWPPRGYKAAW